MCVCARIDKSELTPHLLHSLQIKCMVCARVQIWVLLAIEITERFAPLGRIGFLVSHFHFEKNEHFEFVG